MPARMQVKSGCLAVSQSRSRSTTSSTRNSDVPIRMGFMTLALTKPGGAWTLTMTHLHLLCKPSGVGGSAWASSAMGRQKNLSLLPMVRAATGIVCDYGKWR